ncbi:hypothetical protein WJX74_008601 [Apatococcus lobatus]|uniref:ARID domain-containing protein n=1 Tax=Apatococcus lobatus TaxID=904363 RepID=A0AAW1SGZ7_9CHLO
MASPKRRLLAILYGDHLDSQPHPQAPLDELAATCSGTLELQTVKNEAWDGVRQRLQSWQPHAIFLSCGVESRDGLEQLRPLRLPDAPQAGGGVASPLQQMFQDVPVECLMVDALIQPAEAEALHAVGIQNVVMWESGRSVPMLPALHFNHAFLTTLAFPQAGYNEAFAFGSHSVQAHCTVSLGGQLQSPIMPRWLSQAPAALPTNASIPPPSDQSLDLSQGIAAAVPGWEDVRLLAPHAELRLLVCGQPSLIDAHRLSFLGEALRAILVLEVRRATVTSTTPCERLPAHLPPGSSALRCSIRSQSGATSLAVLGGPPSVLSNPGLVEHALRQTLVADALSLQFRLPPPSLPPPAARSLAHVAGRTPVVDALVLTSVWAVQVLRILSQDPSFRGLVSLGIGGVGGSPVASFRDADVQRFTSIVQSHPDASTSQAVAQQLVSTPAPANGAAPSQSLPRPSREGSEQEGDLDDGQDSELNSSFVFDNGATPGDVGTGITSEMAMNGVGHMHPGLPPVWQSNRPPMHECPEEAFLSDLAAFLRERKHAKINTDNFPDAVLNGQRLDLFNLYREVSQRGGWKVGNGINWKGQVFPKMRNFSNSHRMTGVGNALKRHYQLYLLDYEQANPADVTGDHCAICGGSDEVSTDWISCDMCNIWVHFGCDRRPYLGTFKDYSKSNGRNYTCPRCAETKRQRTS